jgi:beta-galactosidase GanA
LPSKLIDALTQAAAATLLLAVGCLAGTSATAQSMPTLVQQQGRATLMVDGAPYFLLGAQVDNSSGWPTRLDAVWPAVERLGLNTLEVPVYWEQMEPARGAFDFTVVDSILAQARAHHVHLVLLWFGTWKNGKMHYVPGWIKADTATYPRMLSKSGVPIDVLSPNSPANLDADRAAFAALMKHLKDADPQHTVIMMQVENESGSLGLVRDFSPMAQKIFDAPVPGDLLRALHKSPGPWSQVFGPDADETFAAWSVSRYINAVAAAGKQELPLPMYVNNWLKSPRAYPIVTVPGVDYPSGGPTINMFSVWKTMAPAIDILAPDIYVPNSENYRKVMRQFQQPGNPLLIPESLGFEPFPGASGYARPLYFALGEGAVGFANFGLDRFDVAQPLSPEMLAVANGFALLGSFTPELAALKFSGRLQTAIEEDGIAQKELAFAADGTPLPLDAASSAPAEPSGTAWRVIVSFPPAYDPPASPVSTTSDTRSLREGRAVVASLGSNQFLVAGIDCRVQFALPVQFAKQPQMLKVEEGRYDGTTWVPIRLWNGDETDYGLNFGGKGSLLRVTMGSY